MGVLPGSDSGKTLTVGAEQVPRKRDDFLRSTDICVGINSVVDSGCFSNRVDDIHHSSASSDRGQLVAAGGRSRINGRD